MKTVFLNKWFFGIAGLALVTAVIGTASQAQSGLVAFELKADINVGDAPLELGKTYKTPSGTEYQVDLLRFYTSNVQLVKADGSSLGVPGVSLTSLMADAPAAGKLMDGG